MTDRAGGPPARRHDIPPRAGLILAALGGLVALFAAGRVGVEQLGGLASVQVDAARVSVLCLGASGLLVHLALSRSPWARPAGAAAAMAFAALALAAVVRLRTADELVPGAGVALAGGGRLLIAGSLLAVIGLVLTILTGFIDPPPRPTSSTRHLDRLAVSLAAVGVVLPPLAAAAAVIGQAAHAEQPRENPLALWGVAGGLGVSAAWSAGLLIAALSTAP